MVFVPLGFMAGAGRTALTAYPADNRTWYVDPDSAAAVTLDGSGRAQRLADVGGDASRFFAQDSYAPGRPPLLTAWGRRMLDFDRGFANFDGSAAVTADFNDFDGPATYYLVWGSPAALATDASLFMGSYTAANPSNMLLLYGADGIADDREMAAFRQKDGVEYTQAAVHPWAPSTLHTLGWRYNAGGSVDFFVDGRRKARLVFGAGDAPAGGIAAAASQMGGYWPGAPFPPVASGKFGAAMRYGVAHTDDDAMVVHGVTLNRYAGPPPAAPTAAYTLFGAAAPDLPFPYAADNQPVTLGTRWRASVPGRATHLRFYKSAPELTITELRLWRAGDGALLATANAPANAPAGWVEVALAAPVAVAAGVDHVVSFFAPSVGYPIRQYHHQNAITSGVLTAPANSTSAPNGAALYGQGAHGFPYVEVEARGYFGDVRFVG